MNETRRRVPASANWDHIPEDTDVLITHEAPDGTLDKNDILGRESAWNMTLVNCAVVNNQRQLTSAPTVVDLVL